MFYILAATKTHAKEQQIIKIKMQDVLNDIIMPLEGGNLPFTISLKQQKHDLK